MADLPNRFLPPAEASAYLASRGLKYSPKTLGKFRCLGGGPAYRVFGRSIYYAPADLDAWIAEKMSGPVSHTAAARAAGARA